MKNVSDIYALSPMQEIMLMHVNSRVGEDVLFNQFCYEIPGELDIAAFEISWQKLVERHDILRTAFLWENLRNPIQVVRDTASLPFELLDWRSEPEPHRGALLHQYCDADRKRGFDARKAPLMRVALIRAGHTKFYFIWSSHHLLLDRWCLPVVFNDLFGLYKSVRDGSNPAWEPAKQFRAYIDWIKRQSESSAEDFWRTTLAGFSKATPLTTIVADVCGEERSFCLNDADRSSLRALATSCGVTSSVLMQGAWSLALNRLSGRQDVVFGAAVAGRPAEIDGVETILGSFVNNVPVRVRLPHDTTLRDWLKKLQQSQHQRGAFEYIAPTSIQQWSELPVGEPIFDTLIVTLAATGGVENADFELIPLAGAVRTAYPLTLSIDDSGPTLSVHAALQAGRRCTVPLEELLELYKATLQNLAKLTSDELIGSLPGFSGRLKMSDLHPAPTRFRRSTLNKRASVANQAGREGISIQDMQDVLRIKWASALGIENIGPEDDFFRLGGSSLQAAALHASIESATRKSLPILTLFQSTTLRGMAETLAADVWPLRSDLAISLRTTGSREPLFCVASPEVNTVGYALLAHYQDKDRPIYVLQAPPDGASMRRLSPRVLPEMATTYLKELRHIQPHGPYYLLGMCTGSQLVMEMARQLDDVGEQPIFAGIINTWAYYTVSRWYHLQRMLNIGSWYAERLKDALHLGSKNQFAELSRVLRRKLSRLSSDSASEFDNCDAPADVETVVDAAGEHDADSLWIREFGWTHKDPQAEKYPGTLTIFRIRRQPFWRTGEADLGWGKHAQHVHVEHLPCKEHDAVLREPHAQIIGQRIAERIKEAEIRNEE